MITKEQMLHALRPLDGRGLNEIQKSALLRLQVAVEEFAHALYDNTPECADRTVAARKLLECKMTAVQAITHTGFEKKETKNADQKAPAQK